MKQLFPFAACFVLLTVTACTKEPETDKNNIHLNQEVTQSSVAGASTVPSVKTASKSASAIPATDGGKPIQVHSAVSAASPKAAPQAAIPADQFLAETISQAREKTNSQSSPTRQRGQRAEDEMNMEIAPPK